MNRIHWYILYNRIHCDNKLSNQSKLELEAEATGACLGLNFDITPFQCKFRLRRLPRSKSQTIYRVFGKISLFLVASEKITISYIVVIIFNVYMEMFLILGLRWNWKDKIG